jgi:RNA polymerase sigma factor (sigma-70 family)
LHICTFPSSLPKVFLLCCVKTNGLINEQELIAQLRLRNEEAFRQLVEVYGGRVYNTVLNMLQDTAEAEDTTQEVFIKVYESIDGFRQEAGLGTWIYQIATRKAIDKLRRRKTRQRLRAFLPWWMPSEAKADKAVFDHPGVQLDNKEKAALLFKAINGLPEKQQLAFTLIKVQGMSYEEAAQVMQQGIKAIESLVGRAKQNLQQQLQSLKNQ